jgi:hypothetical protein
MTRMIVKPNPPRLEEDTSDAELEALAVEASAEAVADSLAHGVSVHYMEGDFFVRENPDGRRFEIEYTALNRNAVRVIRELPRRG